MAKSTCCDVAIDMQRFEVNDFWRTWGRFCSDGQFILVNHGNTQEGIKNMKELI